MGRKVTLPSGAVLEISLAGFSEGKALYQAFLEEIRSMKMDPDMDIDSNLAKDLVCMTFASKRVEDAVWACMARATYAPKGQKGTLITTNTFEPAEARGDYFDVVMEVGRENIAPFTKGLLQKYGPLLKQAWESFLASMQKRTTSSSTTASPESATAASAT